MELSNTELINIHGGGIGKWVIIAGAVSFVIGFLDGFLRPLK